MTQTTTQAWAKWLVIAVVIILVGCGAWYAWGYFGTKGSIDAAQDAQTSSAEVKPATPTGDPLALTKQPEEMTPTEFSALPLVSKLDYAGPILNSDTAATTDRLNVALDGLGWGTYNYFNRPVVPPALHNNTQEIWDQYTLASFQAWERSRQGTIGVDDALKWSQVIAEGEKYTDLTGTFKKDLPLIPIGVGHEQTKVQLPKSGKYAAFDSVISFTKQEVFVEDPYNPEYTKVTMGYKKGNVDNSGRWILLEASQSGPPSS